MSDPRKPLVTADELNALIEDWGALPYDSVDKFYPVRFWFLFVLMFGFSAWLLFNTDAVARSLSSQPMEVERIARFLYFRGWFLSVSLLVGTYIYYKNKYLALVLSGMFLVGCVNFVFDLFNVYAETLSRPTPKHTIGMLLRFVAMWFVYLNIRNASRVPDLQDRFNILLPFRRNPDPSGR